MTQPDIEVFVQWALAEEGKEYRNWDPDRWQDPYDDCSSLCVKGLRHAGVIVPEWVRNTVTLWQWGKQIGGLISVAEGVELRGSVMLRGRWYGYGNLGHASVSCGRQNGVPWEMAAHGRKSGIHDNAMNVGRYHDALIVPWANYHNGAPVDLAGVARLMAWRDRVTKRPLALNESGSDVAILNNLLKLRGYKVKDGSKYGRPTQVAVHEFKKAYPKKIGNTDGKHFGGPAADALLGL